MDNTLTSSDRLCPPAVLAYVDPSCPFAWTAAQWLLEVASRRPLSVTFDVMSVSVVNEHAEIDDWYRDFCSRAWGPARVSAAVTGRYGPGAFHRLYLALGRRIHDAGDKDLARVIPAALSEAGLPTELATLADDPSLDEDLRRRTAFAQSQVGEQLGTPTLVLEGVGFFGPVLTAIPRGDDAVALFDAVRTLTATSAFSEMKRRRSGQLSFA